MVDKFLDGIDLTRKKGKGGPGGARKRKDGLPSKPGPVIVLPGHEPPNALQPWDYLLLVDYRDDDPTVDLDCWKWEFNTRTWRAWEQKKGAQCRYSRDE